MGSTTHQYCFWSLGSVTSLSKKVRFNAVLSKHAGAWFNALPSPCIGVFVDNERFIVVVGFRLGWLICAEHQCSYRTEVDNRGTHGLSYKFTAGRFLNHQVSDIIKRALISVGDPSVPELIGTSSDDGKRPDGMTHILWQRGKSRVWNFTCVDTLALSHICCLN